MRLRQGRVYLDQDLFTLGLQHTPDMVIAIEDTNQVLAPKKGDNLPGEGGRLGRSGGVVAYLRSNTMAVRTIAGAAFVTGIATALLGSLGQAEVFDDLRWPMLFIPLGVLAMVFWVSMLIDCAINEPRAGNDKVVWVIIIVFTQLIGAAIYLFVRRPQRMAESRR